MLVYLSLVKPFKEKSDNLLNILYTLFLLLLYLLGFILASPLNSSYSFSFGLCILLGIFAINLAIWSDNQIQVVLLTKAQTIEVEP